MRATRNSRWPLAAVAASIALVLGLGVLAAVVTGRSTERAKATHRSDRLTEQRTLAGLTGQYLRFAAAEVRGLAQSQDWQLRPGSAHDTAVLRRFARTSPLFRLGVALVDTAGRPLDAAFPGGQQPPAATNPAYAPMRAGLAAGKPGVSDVLRVGTTPAAAIAVPVGSTKAPRALLVGYADLAHWPLEGYTRKLHLGQGTQLLVLDGRGVCAAGSDPGRIGHRVARAPGVRAALDGATGIRSYQRGDGRWVVSNAPVGLGGWVNVIRQPEAHFYGALHQNRLAVLIALAAVLTCAVIVIVVVTYLRQRTVRQLAADAVVDPLTGLATRRLLNIRLQYAVPRNRRAGTHLAVLFCDLDGFKSVNDRFGHACGDEVLQTVAARLRRSVREEDLIARVGGDEFVILVEELRDLAELQDLGHRLLAGVAEPVELPHCEVRVRVSIGVAVLPPHSSEGDEVLQVADRAMYDAKAAGGGVRTVTLGDATLAGLRDAAEPPSPDPVG